MTHNISLPPALVAMARAMRGGRERLVERVDPARLAHVVIDLQNGYMEEGAPLEVPMARAIVPAVNRLSAAVRAAGGTNIFIRYTMYPDAVDDWSTWHREHNAPAGLEGTLATFSPGAHHWQLWPGLDVGEGDLIAEKQRFSAFTPGTSDLEGILRARGIDTLIITGTMTNVCCESTARDAMQRNYRVLFASDATAAWSDEAHNASLANICMVFGDVMTVDEIIALTQQGL